MHRSQRRFSRSRHVSRVTVQRCRACIGAVCGERCVCGGV
nr:MAG TPA: hypothetical protein [Caudoviricetes sp.]